MFSPSNFSFLSTDGNNLSKTSFRFFQENYTHLFVFIRENFRADVIRLDICPREDETKFRLLFDRSIAGGQDIDTIVDMSFFPLFGWIFPSRWIEKRKSEILWRRRLIGIILNVSMFFEYREKFKKRLIARQISDFEKYFEF